MLKKTDLGQQKLKRMLKAGKTVWILYIDIVKFHEVEFRYGYKACNHILESLEEEIENTLKRQKDYFHFAFLESRGGDDYVVYLVPKEKYPWAIIELNEYWVNPLTENFNRRIKKFVDEKILLRSGVVQCFYEKERSPEYLLYAAVKEAFLLNKTVQDKNYFVCREELNYLLKEQNEFLNMAFQPIVDVQSGRIYGYEALARLRESKAFSNIADLFPFAERIGQLYAVETLCRRKAIAKFPAISVNREMLFLNINPQVLSDPEFASGQTRKLLNEQGLNPSNVILEITERSAIDDFAVFRDALGHYRNQGYLIALDDVGAGYSSLQSIAELHPDFLKIDRSLIEGVNADPIKWALLETFVNFSKRIGCRVIAEGVETLEEMRAVVQLGVNLVQGYFLARPSFEKSTINEKALDIIKNEKRRNPEEKSSIQAYIEPLPFFQQDTTVATVEAYFRNRPNQWLVCILDQERIVGVIHRDKLFAALGTRYGVSLYSDRGISLLIDRNPLIVEDTTPIEVVSSLAMQRKDTQLYDGIVVTAEQKPIGMVSVATLTKAMAEQQIKVARGANPLTGLPGNLRIEQELKERIERREGFGVIYVDLNKFKHYNDLYGFQQGDMVIKKLGNILISEVPQMDDQAFIGHNGGDDFIVLLCPHKLEECAQSIIKQFSQEAVQMMGTDELSVALAGVVVNFSEDALWSPVLVSEKAAGGKKEAKSIGGNAFILR